MSRMQTLQVMCANEMSLQQMQHAMRITGGMLPVDVVCILNNRAASALQAIARRRLAPWPFEEGDCERVTAEWLCSKFVTEETKAFVIESARRLISTNLAQPVGRGNCVWVPSWVCQCSFGPAALRQLRALRTTLKIANFSTLSFCIRDGTVLRAYFNDSTPSADGCGAIQSDIGNLVAKANALSRWTFVRGTIAVCDRGRVYVFFGDQNEFTARPPAGRAPLRPSSRDASLAP